MISFKQINYALAVEQERHFKRAADACNVSQSALSTAVSEMENQLGVMIFERDNKKVLVTPIGEQILAKAREIKLQVEDLHNLSAGKQEPLSYPITIGVIPTIGPFLLPKVLPSVKKAFPRLSLKVVEATSNELVEQVRIGAIDTAILALPYSYGGLHAFSFWEEDFCLVAHKNSDYAKTYAEGNAIASSEIDARDLLLLQEGHCLKDQIIDACKIKSVESNASLAGTSLYTLVQMVAGNLGVTLVPEMAVKQMSKESKDLRFIPLKDKGPHRSLAFMTRLNYSGVSGIQALIKVFQATLS